MKKLAEKCEDFRERKRNKKWREREGKSREERERLGEYLEFVERERQRERKCVFYERENMEPQ